MVDLVEKFQFIGISDLKNKKEVGLKYHFLCLTCGEVVTKDIWVCKEAEELHEMIKNGLIPYEYFSHEHKFE